MPSKPIRIFVSPFSKRIYATRSYKEITPGRIQVTGEQCDVTDDVLSACVFDGSIVLTKDEVGILNKLLAGFHVGPQAKAVLDKLKGAA